MDWKETVALGFLGGLLPDLIRILKDRHGSVPDYVGRIYFWLSLVGLGALGALAAWLGGPEKVAQALALGFSAPGVLSRLLASGEDQDHFPKQDGPPSSRVSRSSSRPAKSRLANSEGQEDENIDIVTDAGEATALPDSRPNLIRDLRIWWRR